MVRAEDVDISIKLILKKQANKNLILVLAEVIKHHYLLLTQLELMQKCLSVHTFCVWFQVALGDSNELLDADYKANNLPDGKHSTKGLGQTGPDPKNSLTL